MGTHTSNNDCSQGYEETVVVENTKTGNRTEFCLNEDCRWYSLPSTGTGFYTKEEWKMVVLSSDRGVLPI